MVGTKRQVSQKTSAENWLIPSVTSILLLIDSCIPTS